MSNNEKYIIFQADKDIKIEKGKSYIIIQDPENYAITIFKEIE
jgi:hypothetical protein